MIYRLQKDTKLIAQGNEHIIRMKLFEVGVLKKQHMRPYRGEPKYPFQFIKRLARSAGYNITLEV